MAMVLKGRFCNGVYRCVYGIQPEACKWKMILCHDEMHTAQQMNSTIVVVLVESMLNIYFLTYL